MSIETFSHQATESETTYFSEEIKQRHDFIEYAPGCKDLLDEAMLSEDDKQLLRKVSANFLVASAVRDEDDIAARRTILQYASSDLQDFYGESGPLGLRRHVSSEGDVTILIDGRELEEVELSIIYRLIEPSTKVLDAAVAYAGPIEIVEDDIEEFESTPEAQPDEAEEWDDLDIFEYEHEPPIEEAHTFRDELRPITGKLIKLLGRKSTRLSGVRIKYAEHEKQKIAS